MTQPLAPFSVDDAASPVDAGPFGFSGLDNTGPDAPFMPPTAPAAPGAPPVADSWLARQKVKGTQLAAASPEQEADDAIAAEDAETEWLRQQHGGTETALSQFARGALDALLSPGALAGAYYETLGTATNAKVLKDFGRDLGRASSGRSAAEALGAVFGGGSAMAKDAGALVGIGEGATEQERAGALDAASRERRALEEQEKARPLLTTISRIAGASAASIGVGAAASAHSGTMATIAALGAEGAGTGAQAAYEQAAPLRDVLASAAIGGIIGAGVGGVAEGVQRGVKKLPDLAKVFGEKAQGASDWLAVNQVVGKDKKAWRALGLNEEDISRSAEILHHKGILDKTGKEALDAISEATNETGATIGGLARKLDADGIAPNVQKMFQEWDDQIAKLRKSGVASKHDIANQLERQVAPLRNGLRLDADPDLQAVASRGLENTSSLKTGMREDSLAKVRQEFASGQPVRPVDVTVYPDGKVALQDGRHRLAVAREMGLDELPTKVSVMDAKGNIIRETVGSAPLRAKPIQGGYRQPTFSELHTFKSDLADFVQWNKINTTEASQEMQRLWATTARTVDEAADQAGPVVGKAWREVSRDYHVMKTMKDAMKRQLENAPSLRYVSMSDYQTGVGAFIATAVTAANPAAALVAGLGTALLHKGARSAASGILSSLTRRFAKMGARVSRAAAGGPEAQEVLELIKRSRMLVDETVERAGANPTVRQAAEETARSVAAREIQKRAGEFNPAEWHARPVTPVQKLVYRSQILDTAADDLARTAKEVETLHPVIPDQLDIRRIEKLTKDAQGPEALAMLQGRVRALAEATPPTVVGDAGAALLRKLSLDLDRAGIAEAMAHAHQAAGFLQNASKNATDEVSQNFAERAALALRDVLGVEQFGSAGREYRALVSRPSDVLKDLSSAEKVREALRVGDHQGGLRKALTSAQAQIAAAHDAAFKLAGAARPAELGKALTNADRLFHAAELATTIDGKGLHKMFDVAGHVGVHEGIPHEAPPLSVAEAVEPGLEKVATAIRHEVAAKAGKVTKDTYTPPYLRAGAAAGTAAAWPALLDEKRDVYDRRLKQLEALATRTDIPRNYQGALAGDVDGKLTKLLTDMPKPTPSLKGKAFESMSEGDLNKANAMWEATTAPLTVFDDLASGALDYDKVSYVWEQYPGLQQASQAGVMDVLISDLDEDERSGVPDSMLTQLDYAFGFKGTLQDTVEHGFATRMSAMYVPPPQPGAPKSNLETPGAEPSFAQRIGNG